MEVKVVTITMFTGEDQGENTHGEVRYNGETNKCASVKILTDTIKTILAEEMEIRL